METSEHDLPKTAAQSCRPAQAPRISVIINNYNYGSFLADAIDSALLQDGPSAEIIVVDDGSSDRSAAVIEGYGEKVQAIFQENGGQAAAINAGVHASRGEILCFLDADDWWTEKKIAAVAAAFDADPEANLVYHRQQPIHADGSYLWRPTPRSLCSGDLTRRLSRSAGFWPFPLTSAVAVRRSAWDQIGDIPETFRISADAWIVGVYPFFGRVSALPEVLGYYRIHTSNNWTQLDEDAAFLKKRMLHWRTTVEQTNRFLAARGLKASLRLEDHFPYHVSAAKLGGCDFAERVDLAIKGLFFPGEPNLLRRMRDALRAAIASPRIGMESDAAEVGR